MMSIYHDPNDCHEQLNLADMKTHMLSRDLTMVSNPRQGEGGSQESLISTSASYFRFPQQLQQIFNE
jgi:hypothetical protein